MNPNPKGSRLLEGIFLFPLLALCLFPSCCLTGGPPEDSAEQAALEQEFTQMLSGATLEGYFTVQGAEPARLRKERYTIEKVSKLAGNLWTIQARIQYGDNDLAVPVPVTVLWAGDTPVVTVTDVSLPGLGTFTARVLFYRGQYAGTWQHGETSGNQFGRIVEQSD